MTEVTQEQYAQLYQQNADLAQLFNELILAYGSKESLIQDKINTLDERINGFMDNVGLGIFTPSSLLYDNSVIYSKNTLNISQDPLYEHKSNWVKITTGDQTSFNISKDKLSILHPITLYSRPPGLDQTPNFNTDSCITKMQFILANDNITSDLINCELKDTSSTLTLHGDWYNKKKSLYVKTIDIDNLSENKTLFIRFVNVNVEPGSDLPPTNIIQTGGDCYVQLNSLVHYDTITF